MRYICVIGDSSTAALKAGWTDIAPSHEDTSLTFFASPGESLRALERSGRCITPNNDAVAASFAMTSGGLSTIDLDDYDEIWIAGLGVSPALSVEVYSGFRSEEHANLGDDQTLVSQQCFDLMVKAKILNSAAVALVRLIEDVVGTVPVISRPLPREDIVSVDPAWAAAIGADASSLIDSFVRGVQEVAGSRMPVTTQPSVVCESLLTTKREYSSDNVALDMVSTAPEIDMWHMNAKFGVEILRQMLRKNPEARSKVELEPVPCGCSSLCSAAMLQHPSSLFADYFKQARRVYNQPQSTSVVMANVTCPRAVEMVQYLTSAKNMFVLWSGTEPGDVQLPAWCQLDQWSLDEVELADCAQQISSIFGDQFADIVVDCNARSETFETLSHLVETYGRGYLAITESSPASQWSRLSAELCLTTYQRGKREVIMDGRHIWATWIRAMPKAEAPGMRKLRSDIIDTFAPKGLEV